MNIRLPDIGVLAYPMTQTRHGVSYLSGEPGRHPSESNKILIFYLTRKGGGQASHSNKIPHALFESSGMQPFPYPTIGYPYIIPQNRDLKNPNSGQFHSPAQWPNVLMGPLKKPVRHGSLTWLSHMKVHIVSNELPSIDV